MTNAEWLACASPARMRGEIHCRRFSHHCWLRFDLACIDRVRDLLNQPQCAALIDALETWLDDPNRDRFRTFQSEKAAVHQAVREWWRRGDFPLVVPRTAAMRAITSIGSGTLATSEMVCVAAGRRVGQPGLDAAVRAERLIHARLMRCVFRSTLSAVVLNPVWRTDTAVSLARMMYGSRDFGAMPILADSLQDAGCDTADILDHCRGDGPHVRGCWVVDLVLGKM